MACGEYATCPRCCWHVEYSPGPTTVQIQRRCLYVLAAKQTQVPAAMLAQMPCKNVTSWPGYVRLLVYRKEGGVVWVLKSCQIFVLFSPSSVPEPFRGGPRAAFTTWQASEVHLLNAKAV